MSSDPIVRRGAGSLLIVATALLAAGCAEELGPVPMPVTRVRGRVWQGERPVSGGWIEFIPVDGTIGNLRSAPLGPDGQFDADGVAIGTDAIRLVNARIGGAPLKGLFASFNSPIRRRIPEAPSDSLRIDLVEEAIKFQQQRSRVMAGERPTTGEAP